jgi:hypothetical protein
MDTLLTKAILGININGPLRCNAYVSSGQLSYLNCERSADILTQYILIQ